MRFGAVNMSAFTAGIRDKTDDNLLQISSSAPFPVRHKRPAGASRSIPNPTGASNASMSLVIGGR
jgi:hypothetical protein